MTQSGQEGSNSGTDGAQGSGQGSGGTGTQGGQGDTTGGQSGADGAQHNSGDDAGKQDTVSRADFDKLQSQLSAADKKRQEAEDKLKEITDKDLSELEKAKQDLQESQARVVELEEANIALQLDNAFLANNTITWQNGTVAIKLARSEGYLDDVQNDKGVVDSKKLITALEKLSKEHAYLVKASDDDGGQGAGSSGQSGMGRGTKGEADKAKEDRLRKTFPALGRR